MHMGAVYQILSTHWGVPKTERSYMVRTCLVFTAVVHGFSTISLMWTAYSGKKTDARLFENCRAQFGSDRLLNSYMKNLETAEV